MQISLGREVSMLEVETVEIFELAVSLSLSFSHPTV